MKPDWRAILPIGVLPRSSRKNAATASSKAVRLLRGRHKLALSGTPVENHIGELWSLFEFLNPGKLGKAGAFRKASVVQRRDGSEDLALQNLGEERLMVFRVAENSPVAGERIKKVGFPAQAHVAAVVRGDAVLMPRGEEALEAGDQVLVFTLTESVERLERLFA